MKTWVLLLIILSPIPLLSQNKPATSPASSTIQDSEAQQLLSPQQLLVNAKKVALVGGLGYVAETGVALNPSAKKAQESLEKEVRKWGRFTIVDSISEADIVLVLLEGNRAAGGGGSIRTARLVVARGGRPIKRGEIPLWEGEASGGIFSTSGAPKVIAQFRTYLESLDSRLHAEAIAKMPPPSSTNEGTGQSTTGTLNTAATSAPPVPMRRETIPVRPAKYIPPLDTISRAKTYSMRGRGPYDEQGKFEKLFAVGKYANLQSAMGDIEGQMRNWGRMQYVEDASTADIVILVYQWDDRVYSRQFHTIYSAVQIVEGGAAFQREDPALWASGTVRGTTNGLISNLRFDLDQFQRTQAVTPSAEANKDYKRGSDELQSAEKKRGHERSDLLFEAVGDLRKSLLSNFGYAPAHQKLATSLLDLGFDSAAAYEFHLALQREPGSYDSLLGLTRALSMIPDVEEAERAARDAIRVSPDRFEAHASLGNALYKGKRYSDASGEYREAIRLQPDNPDLRSELARSLYRDKEFGEAEAGFQEVLRLKPDDEASLLWLGSTLNEEKKNEAAIPFLRKAMTLDPKDDAAHYELGRALRARKDYAAAIEELKKAIAINSTAATYHIELARTLADNGQLDDALAKCQEIVLNLPDDASAHDQLGTMLLKKARTDEAIKEFEDATKLDPKLAAAYFHLGQARESKGDTEGARSAYEMARNLDPQNPDFNTPQ